MHDGSSPIKGISTWGFPPVNKLNPVYIQSLSEKNVNSKRFKDDLKVPIRNSVTLGDKNV